MTYSDIRSQVLQLQIKMSLKCELFNRKNCQILVLKIKILLKHEIFDSKTVQFHLIFSATIKFDNYITFNFTYSVIKLSNFSVTNQNLTELFKFHLIFPATIKFANYVISNLI